MRVYLAKTRLSRLPIHISGDTEGGCAGDGGPQYEGLEEGAGNHGLRCLNGSGAYGVWKVPDEKAGN